MEKIGNRTTVFVPEKVREDFFRVTLNGYFRNVCATIPKGSALPILLMINFPGVCLSRRLER